MHPSLVNKKMLCRHPLLMSLEGWYKSAASVPAGYEEHFAAYFASGSKLKITKWLLRQGRITQKEAVSLGEKLVGVSFKLSCRFNDLRRMTVFTESKGRQIKPHFESCFRPSGLHADQPFNYMRNRDVVLAYVPDAKGDFIWRCAFNLCRDPDGKFCLVSYRAHGNGPDIGIMTRINALLPVVFPEYAGTSSAYRELIDKNSEKEIIRKMYGVSKYDGGYREYSDVLSSYDCYKERMVFENCRKLKPIRFVEG